MLSSDLLRRIPLIGCLAAMIVLMVSIAGSQGRPCCPAMASPRGTISSFDPNPDAGMRCMLPEWKCSLIATVEHTRRLPDVPGIDENGRDYVCWSLYGQKLIVDLHSKSPSIASALPGYQDEEPGSYTDPLYFCTDTDFSLSISR